MVQLYNLEKERLESHQHSLQMAEQLLLLSKENQTLKKKLVEQQPVNTMETSSSKGMSSRQLTDMLENVRGLIDNINK